MTTLSKITEFTRKTFLWIGLGIIAIILVVIGIQVFGNFRQQFFPPPPTPPTVGFGKLPAIQFTPTITQSFSYSLSTLTGALPNLGGKATVYKLFSPQPSLVAFNNTSKLMTQNGFTSQPTQISETKFSWKKDDPLNSTILYDTFTNDFMFSSNFLQSASKNNTPPNTPSAMDTAKNFFTNYETIPADIDSDKTQTSLFSITNGTLANTTTIGNAQIIRVDYFQKDINGLHIYTQNYPHSYFYALVEEGSQQASVVEAAFVHKTVLTDFFATYPIISTQEAFAKLQKGEGYISNYSGTGMSVIIRDVTLGYYLDKNSANFLMPIIVFHGDNDFYAFIPAITDTWTGM